ncbi:MAG TPA: hypothetical protein VHG28_17410 [Longimicrobiaceae bacterium]|nr:hypothetical protein [Longimicrobiaceae bacterium]
MSDSGADHPLHSGAASAPSARLVLGGHASTPAHLDALVRPARTRAIRAVASLAVCWGLAPLVFFIPPHLPWVLTALAGGIYLAYRQWSGEYVVRSFEGSCPRCGNALALKPGERIRLPHTLTCYRCHHHPVLHVAVPAAPGG